MRVNILSDTDAKAKVDQVTWLLSPHTFFAGRDYGPGLSGLAIILMCRTPDLLFRRRVRMDRKERCLYTDVMLHFPSMKAFGHQGRRLIVLSRLLTDIPPTIAKYRLPDFDLAAFTNDFTHMLEEQLLGPESFRRDHLCLP
jgi:hypothetical protein